MIITSRLYGGIGNQLFQIAAAYNVSQKLGYKLLYESNPSGHFEWFSATRTPKSWPSEHKCANSPSKYHSTIYRNIEFTESLLEVSQIVGEAALDPAYPVLPSNRHCVALDGYFQSDQFWKEYTNEVKQLFTLNEGAESYLKDNTDIFDHYPELEKRNDFSLIGVRRGDYVGHPVLGNVVQGGMTYFDKAIKTMGKERYYVVSEDIEWCKQNFVGDRFHFLDIKDDLICLLVMTLFKNHIISNSTYHWWASFLSRYDKPFVIAPSRWRQNGRYTIYRDDMLVLEW